MSIYIKGMEFPQEHLVYDFYPNGEVWEQNWQGDSTLVGKAIPAADVVPVRYGCWNADKEDVEWGNSLIRYRCSVCNERPHFDKEEYKFILSPYCPNCGAKMDKE